MYDHEAAIEALRRRLEAARTQYDAAKMAGQSQNGFRIATTEYREALSAFTRAVLGGRHHAAEVRK